MARKPKAVTPAATAPSVPAAPAVRSEIKGSTPVTPKAAPRQVSHEEIAKRAYEIYAARGYAPGNPDEDWHEAERQLRAGL